MGSDINETNIYAAFREKELRANCKPDEKVVFIGGCPTVVKKGWLALRLMGLRAAVNGRKTMPEKVWAPRPWPEPSKTEAGREAGCAGQQG